MSLKGREIERQRREAERNARIRERRNAQPELPRKRMISPVTGRPNMLLASALIAALCAQEDRKL